MNKVIITGATGFVGSNLCRKLVSNNWEVSIISRSNSNYSTIEDIIHKIDIYEYDGNIISLVAYFKKKNAHVVYHLASYVITEHESHQIDNLIESNIKFGLHILEAMKESKTKLMINTGTFWQHYHSENYNPVDLYAATKQAFESLIKYYTEAENLRVITLKLFDTYGGSDTRPKLINLLHKFADENKEIKMSPGEQVLDLVHVDDVVNAFIKAYEYLIQSKNIKYEEFGVGSGRQIKLKDLIRIFEEVTDKKINVIWGGRDYRKREVMNLWSDYKLVPKWKSEISIEEGLRSMVYK